MFSEPTREWIKFSHRVRRRLIWHQRARDVPTLVLLSKQRIQKKKKIPNKELNCNDIQFLCNNSIKTAYYKLLSSQFVFEDRLIIF